MSRKFKIFLFTGLFFGLFTEFALAFNDDDDNEIEPQIWFLSIEGNDTFANQLLLNQIAAESPNFFQRRKFWDRTGYELVENELRRDVIRLERFYQRRGFPFVQVRYEIIDRRKDWQKRVIFHINEGEPTIIDEVTFHFIEDGDPEEVLREARSFQRLSERHQLREGRRYERIRHSDVEGEFLNVLNNMGYPFPRVSVDAEMDSLQNTAHVHIEIDSGPIGFFHEFRISGLETATEEQLIRESALRIGDQYSQRSIRNAQQQIFGHHLYRFVTISVPEQERDSLVTLDIRVREHALRSLQVQFGVGLEEIVRTSVSWQHRNPWGTTHSFRARTRLSFLEQGVNLDYRFPYVFNTYSSFAISPFVQRLNESNFVLQRYGVNNSFLYQYSQDLAGTISYEFTRNDEELVSPDVELDPEFRYDISAIQIFGYYGQPFAERGQNWVIRPFSEISGFFGTGTLKYQRFSVDVRRFIDLGSSTQLALRTETGLLYSDDLLELPSNIRYYAGGTGNVRGWQRRMLGPKRPAFNDDGEFERFLPLGGRANLIFNTEIRQDLGFLINNFGMSVFFDGGQVWQRIPEYDISDLQYSVGGGFRYNSPVGPIRIDMGYKINPTDEDLRIFEGVDYGNWFDRWGLHFSIGQAF